MRTRRLRRIRFEDWFQRVDEMLGVFLGRKAHTFEGFDWRHLYDHGCTPGEVLDALAEVMTDND